MKITQLRSATIIVEHQQYVILVDPMLADQGEIPPLKWLTVHPARNPTIALPGNANEMLSRVTHCLITHCQKGHFDHLDRQGKKFLRDKRTPVFCTEADSDYLRSRGFDVIEIRTNQTSDFLGGSITPTPCLHGAGFAGRFMAHGSGFVIRWLEQPVLYLSGDTVMTDDVRTCLLQHKPDISVIPAGGARFEVGGEIIMGMDDAIAFCKLNPGITIANHLEALDHCPVTRAGLRAAAQGAGVSDRLLIPLDGETIAFG
jgi:L-ascorbate metabolism protein UlaG (beta-lactamase superfamily)